VNGILNAQKRDHYCDQSIQHPSALGRVSGRLIFLDVELEVDGILDAQDRDHHCGVAALQIRNRLIGHAPFSTPAIGEMEVRS